MLLHGADQSVHIALASAVPQSCVSCVQSLELGIDESKSYVIAWRIPVCAYRYLLSCHIRVLHVSNPCNLGIDESKSYVVA